MWALFSQKFNYVFKHRTGKNNIAVDALSRGGMLMTMVRNEITSFDPLKEHYEDDMDFGDIWRKLLAKEYLKDYTLQSGCLFKRNYMCIPKTSLREMSIREHHIGG